MGDRAQVIVKSDKNKVYLYSHWDGVGLIQIVQRAMSSERGRRRWDDGPYLARIIFSEMIKNDIDGETGFGIWDDDCGGDFEIEVDVKNKKIEYNGLEESFAEFAGPSSNDKWAGEKVKDIEP